MNKKQKGFSLIGLLIVVAIILIVAAIATAAYRVPKTFSRVLEQPGMTR
jgi:prepilin-type N-terminal cleavage/methylation domain-containing protein